MKATLFGLLLACGLVHAGTLVQLPIPAEIPRTTYPSAAQCAAVGFNAG